MLRQLLTSTSSCNCHLGAGPHWHSSSEDGQLLLVEVAFVFQTVMDQTRHAWRGSLGHKQCCSKSGGIASALQLHWARTWHPLVAKLCLSSLQASLRGRWTPPRTQASAQAWTNSEMCRGAHAGCAQESLRGLSRGVQSCLPTRVSSVGAGSRMLPFILLLLSGCWEDAEQTNAGTMLSRNRALPPRAPRSGLQAPQKHPALEVRRAGAVSILPSCPARVFF